MMKSRKGTPDIMSGLMQGEPTSTIQEPASNKVIKPASNKVSSIESIKTLENQKNNKAIKAASKHEDITNHTASNKAIKQELKEKATFNLSLDTLELLEDAWIKLRRKLKGTQRVTKTLIVEKAINIALEELEAKSEMSRLYKELND